MRRPSRAAARVLLAVLLPPAAAAAAPQQEEHRVHREVVVLGSQPAHLRPILDQLAHRGHLGVEPLNLTPELRRHFGAPGESGVLVARVSPQGPADAAGVLVGDVLIAVDGEPVGSTSQLVGRIGRRHGGDEIELELIRGGAQVTLRATLAEAERRQIEIGQFVWRGGEGGPLVLDLDPVEAQPILAFDPQQVERLIAVDSQAINESVSRLLERLEEQGGIGSLRLDHEHRRRLEERIAELEERLRSMERLLQGRGGGGGAR